MGTWFTISCCVLVSILVRVPPGWSLGRWRPIISLSFNGLLSFSRENKIERNYLDAVAVGAGVLGVVSFCVPIVVQFVIAELFWTYASLLLHHYLFRASLPIVTINEYLCVSYHCASYYLVGEGALLLSLLVAILSRIWCSTCFLILS